MNNQIEKTFKTLITKIRLNYAADECESYYQAFETANVSAYASPFGAAELLDEWNIDHDRSDSFYYAFGEFLMCEAEHLLDRMDFASEEGGAPCEHCNGFELGDECSEEIHNPIESH